METQAAAMVPAPPTRRILTGMRTTGPLHLGHYVGALKTWIELEPEYECFFLLADYQALTTHFDRIEAIEASVRDVVLDWISVGLDPERSAFVLQSSLPVLHELTGYLSLFVSMSALQNNPTLKTEIRDHGMESVTAGFMMYPVSQVADILLFSPDPADGESYLLVPVGQDQVPHIEMTREVARRFNRQYGQVFIDPFEKVGAVPRLGGLDGDNRKMGKSYGNAINLSDPPEDVVDAVRAGVTDTNKKRRGDPGDPDICNVFKYHEIFRPSGVAETREGCQSGALGCVECKGNLSTALNAMLDPIRERRARAAASPSLVRDTLISGLERARMIADRTMERVRSVMHLHYPTIFTP